MRWNQFLHAELDALAVLSRNTFRVDDPDLAAQRWQAVDTEQSADAAWLHERGIITLAPDMIDPREAVWMLSPTGLERARAAAGMSRQHFDAPTTTYDVGNDEEDTNHLTDEAINLTVFHRLYGEVSPGKQTKLIVNEQPCWSAHAPGTYGKRMEMDQVLALLMAAMGAAGYSRADVIALCDALSRGSVRAIQCRFEDTGELFWLIEAPHALSPQQCYLKDWPRLRFGLQPQDTQVGVA